jgi:glycosyltransferase involved in cell wall biosynthesis
MRASIIICTYNRALSLSRTLESLADQDGASFYNLETLVIDNNSDDDTETVVRGFAHRLPFRYCREPAQGLSHARNRGISESLGDTLIFTDDDVVLDRGWLAGFLRAFDVFPEAGYFGGRMRPDWSECRPPSWLVDESLPLLSGVLGCHDLGETSRPYVATEDTPFGASFAVRRSVFAEFGGFRVDLGVKGGSRGRGEDTEFLTRARSRGISGVYVGEALCRHRVDRGRLTLPALYRYGVESGIAHRKIANRNTRGSILEAAGFIVRGVRQLILGRGDRFRQCIINAGIQSGLRR